MKNAVLISIQPKWCRMIKQGKKTVEVRKTYPKAPDLPRPFKCYIYCTKEKWHLLEILKDGTEIYGTTYRGKPAFIKTPSTEYMSTYEQGCVIGEFDCETIESLVRFNRLPDAEPEYCQPLLGSTCLTDSELAVYGSKKPLYGWSIKNLIIYPSPVPLASMGLKRPPQSWCYVEQNDELKQKGGVKLDV